MRNIFIFQPICKALILFFAYLPTTSMAQSGQTPTSGNSYYIRNVSTNQYLCQDGRGRVMLSESGAPLTVRSANSTVGTYYLLNSSDTLSATVAERLMSNGGMYNEWTFTALGDGKYNVALRNSGVNAYTYLEYSDLAGDVLRNPLAPSASEEKAQWVFVSEDNYEIPTLVLNQVSENYNAVSGVYNVHLIRPMAFGSWNTFCSPFDINSDKVKELFGTECEVAEFTGITENTVDFTLVSSIEAGKPYLIWPTKEIENASVGYIIDNVNSFVSQAETVTHGDVSFVGSFVRRTVPAGDYVISKNMIVCLTGTATMNGFRAFFHVNPESTAKLINWSLNGAVSSIEEIVGFNKGKNDIYNISGQKVRANATSLEGLPNGLYIVNGTKVVKR